MQSNSSDPCDTDSLRKSIENSSSYETESFYKQTDPSSGTVEYGATLSDTERVGFRTDQGDNEDADRILRAVIQWDLSSQIPQNASICKVSIKINTAPNRKNKFSFQKWGLESKPIGGATIDEDAFQEIGSSTTYRSDSTRSSDGVFLGTVGSEELRSDVKQQLDDGWLAVGVKNENESNESSLFRIVDSGPEPVRLTITYAVPPRELPSVISSNTTLTSSGGGDPYIVTGTSTIESDATLTINSGVFLEFRSGAGIVVKQDSRIVADGSSGLPIRFLSQDVGQNTTWKNIVVRGDNSVFKNVEIRNAGGDCSSSCPALKIAANSVEVTNANIHDNAHAGIGATETDPYQSSTFTLTSSTLRGNGGDGLKASWSNMTLWQHDQEQRGDRRES